VFRPSCREKKKRIDADGGSFRALSRRVRCNEQLPSGRSMDPGPNSTRHPVHKVARTLPIARVLDYRTGSPASNRTSEIPVPNSLPPSEFWIPLFLKKRCPAGTGSDPRPPRRLLSVHARHNTGRGRLLSAAILLNWRRTRARGRRTRSAGSISPRR